MSSQARAILEMFADIVEWVFKNLIHVAFSETVYPTLKEHVGTIFHNNNEEERQQKLLELKLELARIKAMSMASQSMSSLEAQKRLKNILERIERIDRELRLNANLRYKRLEAFEKISGIGFQISDEDQKTAIEMLRSLELEKSRLIRARKELQALINTAGGNDKERLVAHLAEVEGKITEIELKIERIKSLLGFKPTGI